MKARKAQDAKNTLEAFDRDIEKRHMEGLWKAFAAPPSREPPTALEPCLWKWRDVYQDLLRAVDVVALGAHEERRVLKLVNPGMRGKKSTTQTIQMSFQIVGPGETARAHRHTIAAVRFVVKGQGAFTTVEGEKLEMEPGDLILTPGWTWHDHGNESAEPIVWIDGLDSPLVHYLGVGFFERFFEERQPVTRPAGFSRLQAGPLRPVQSEAHGVLPYRYRGVDTLAALRARRGDAGSPFDGVLMEYTNPSTGGPTFPTLSCRVQMLRPGERTKAHRHTSSACYHAVSGRGSTVVGGETFDWEQGDCFVIPPWYGHKHANASRRDEAVLFSLSDSPMLEALGMHREEPLD
ncbi:MAG TPA: cupin domain-containing protein [Candidatus Binatia bacterium]